MNNDKINSQTHDNATFDRPPITSCVCTIGSEKYPERGIRMNYGENNYIEPYREIKNFFKNVNEDETLNPFISQKDFFESYNLYVFDVRHQPPHISSQTIRVEFNFNAPVVATGYNVWCLISTNKLISAW